MEDTRDLHLRRLQGRLQDIAYEITRVRFTSSQPALWHPAINAYRCRDAVVIAAELAGLARSEIELQIEPRRVCLRGRRTLPEPPTAEGPALHVLAMEIDDGPFEREIVLPAEIIPAQAHTKQHAGILWVVLPLAPEPHAPAGGRA